MAIKMKNQSETNDFQSLLSFKPDQIDQLARFFVSNIVEGTIDCLREEAEEDINFSKVKQSIESCGESAVDMFEDHMGYFMERVIESIKKVNIKVEKMTIDQVGLDDVDVTIE